MVRAHCGFATAAACLGLYLVAATIDPGDALVFAIVLRAAVLAATVVLVHELRDRSERLEQDHSELAALREALTPAAMPKLPGLDVAVEFLPAEHGVSGDFYLLTNGTGGTNIAIVGDVCGHGPAAAQRATFARATLASVAASSDDPEEILSLVNRTLLERWTAANFLTAACICHDPRRGTIRWATAGHPSPIRLSDLTELDGVRSAPLGVDAATRFPAQVGRFAPPEGLLLYTDGLLDARGPTDRFGEERLHATLAGHARGSATGGGRSAHPRGRRLRRPAVRRRRLRDRAPRHVASCRWRTPTRRRCRSSKRRCRSGTSRAGR